MEEEIDPVEVIENEPSDDVAKETATDEVSLDTKTLIQYFVDEKVKFDKQKEIEKQEKIESETLEKKVLEEQKIIIEKQELEQKEIIEKKEQELIDSEIEFRENLMTDLKETNLKLDEVITYNSKSDGFSDDIALVSEKMDLVVENTQHSEMQESNNTISMYADVAIIGLTVIVLPIYALYRWFKSIFSWML